MLRRLTGILCLLAITCGGLAGCASMGMGKSKPFGRNEQWEPEVTEDSKGSASDWRSAPSNLRQGSARASKEDRLDRLIWSDEARDINRSLGGSL